MIQGSQKCAEKRIWAHKSCLAFEAEPENPQGGRICDFPRIRPEKMCWCTWRLWGWTFLDRERLSCAPLPQALGQYLTATKHLRVGVRGVKSLQRWQKRLSQDYRAVSSQKHSKFKEKRSLWQHKEISQSVKDLIKGAASAQVPNVHLSDFTEREITKSCLSNRWRKEMLF